MISVLVMEKIKRSAIVINMRNDKDALLLEEAYKNVQVVQEGKFKSAIAAAAMGLTGAAHGQMTADDYADRANPPIEQKQEAPKLDGETPHYKAKVAFDTAIKQKFVDELTLQRIALDKDIAQRYALFLIQHGKEIPKTIKSVISKYSSDLERSFSSGTKN